MGEIGENILNLKYIYYSPRIIFFNRVNSSNISSLSELKPPPGWAAVAGAAGVLGGVPGAPGAAGGPGLFAKAGGFAAGAVEGSPDPGVGGSFGAGGKSPAYYHNESNRKGDALTIDKCNINRGNCKSLKIRIFFCFYPDQSSFCV